VPSRVRGAQCINARAASFYTESKGAPRGHGMAIAPTLEQYLIRHRVEYDLLVHPRILTGRESVEAARIPAGCLAKAVVLEDERGVLMVTLPATHGLQVEQLRRELHRTPGLAGRARVAQIFHDCTPEAIPGIGPAYGVHTLLDEALTGLDAVYFEAGDQLQLVHVSGEHFLELLANARRGSYGRPYGRS
jgi:Ala-tRNA(Pro) deacylase